MKMHFVINIKTSGWWWIIHVQCIKMMGMGHRQTWKITMSNQWRWSNWARKIKPFSTTSIKVDTWSNPIRPSLRLDSSDSSFSVMSIILPQKIFKLFRNKCRKSRTRLWKSLTKWTINAQRRDFLSLFFGCFLLRIVNFILFNPMSRVLWLLTLEIIIWQARLIESKKS